MDKTQKLSASITKTFLETPLSPNELKIVRACLQNASWSPNKAILSAKKEKRVFYTSQAANFPKYANSLIRRGILEDVIKNEFDKRNKHKIIKKRYFRLRKDRQAFLKLLICFELEYLNTSHRTAILGQDEQQDILEEFYKSTYYKTTDLNTIKDGEWVTNSIIKTINKYKVLSINHTIERLLKIKHQITNNKQHFDNYENNPYLVPRLRH